MEKHPRLRIQFFMDGPFDPIESLSATILDEDLHPYECIALGGSHPQYEIWNLIATMAAEMIGRHGTQDELPYESPELTGQ